MTLFHKGVFTLHSGKRSDWFIDCGQLTDEDWATLAYLIQKQISFRRVIGVPTGGLKLAQALEQYAREECVSTLIVDDVLTTGKSMEEIKAAYLGQPVMGAVVFSRGICPDWIFACFRLRPVLMEV